jgi:hypothetical protein
MSEKWWEQKMGFAILTDDEFLAMVAEQEQPAELNEALLEMRRDGKIQIFNDGTGDPLIIQLERTN